MVPSVTQIPLVEEGNLALPGAESDSSPFGWPTGNIRSTTRRVPTEFAAARPVGVALACRLAEEQP
jgi:hypothetical protein